MHSGLLYILQEIKPRTSEELATRTHGMGLNIANKGAKDFPVPKVRKDKKEIKCAEKIVNTVKKSIVVNTTPMKFSKRKEKLLEKQLIQILKCKRPEQVEKDENPEVIACHAINAKKEESIPSRTLKKEGVTKELSRFNVGDLLLLSQETKTIALSNSSAPAATYESTPYYMSIKFSDEDFLLGSKLHSRPLCFWICSRTKSRPDSHR
ncbi:ty3-gypsy retrotransposon protein [Cucumis melo var. makuwa]|uniref:Ty3-gypsy retrotransposon protein n=1 Tax=Cucumis melo var. makuwa TaxID=1194695 RepID=A0A5D3C317_CUCMM|nr:ty3-gypsy retrotransposon protein [Cucumis melo var. makuwa]TYK06303.1 ty3-gypsy retrotransposon protein [Cucumis melo var. makuwa]